MELLRKYIAARNIKEGKGVREVGKNKKKISKDSIKFAVFFGICIILGVFIGVFTAKYMPQTNKDGSEMSIVGILTYYTAQLIILYIMILVQIIIHEGGHLIFGLLSGYKFISFRVGSFLIKNNKGKMEFAKYKLEGTGGQCIMAPPKMQEGKLPYVLYNLGGVIMNLATVVIALPFLIFLLSNDLKGMGLIALLIFASFGMIFALTNGIPLNVPIPNDGYNILSIYRDKDALKSFYYQLEIHNKVLFDTSIAELDVDEFKINEDANLVNPLNTNILLMEVSYYMAKFDFHKAKSTMERLFPYEDKIASIFQREINIEYTFLELMTEGNREVVEERFTPKLIKTCSALKNMLDKQRTLLAYEALYNDDIEKALKIKEDMIKNASKYPFQGQVEVELETVDKILEKYYEKHS